MSRVASGAITLVDIADGGSPISAFLTNENHTFIAPLSGDVVQGERENFETDVMVFVGTTEGTYTAFSNLDATATYHNYYSIDTNNITYSPNTWEVSVNSAGKITMASSGIPTGGTDKSCTVSIPLKVNDKSGTLKSITLQLTLIKSIAAANGAVIQLSPSKQFFTYDDEATLSPSGQNDIVIGVLAQGDVGTLSIEKNIDGSGWTTLANDTSANGDTADKAVISIASGSSSTVFDSGDTITISPGNFADSNVFTVKVTGATGGIDSTSIVRVKEGAPGAASLYLTIESSDGVMFKNNTGSPKTLTCVVIDMESGTELTHSSTSGQYTVNYDWSRVNAGGSKTDVKVTSVSDRSVVSTGGVSADGDGKNTLIVGPEDISDNSSTQFSCKVTVTLNT